MTGVGFGMKAVGGVRDRKIAKLWVSLLSDSNMVSVIGIVKSDIDMNRIRLTSSRKKNPATSPTEVNVAPARQGKRYGYFWKMRDEPKIEG